MGGLKMVPFEAWILRGSWRVVEGHGKEFRRVTDVFAHPSFDDHEQVIFVSDQKAGLEGIIGLHSTALGPAAGGCRMVPYSSTEAALKDVLRLSRGMTFKNAVAGLPLGGGKCVVIGDPNASDKTDKLRALARHVQRLGGRYWTAIDVGASAEDVDVMGEECEFVFAGARELADDAPASHYTSLGGFRGVRAVARFLRGSGDLMDLAGLTVAVQGVGKTGVDLIRQLVESGAEVVAADIDLDAVQQVAERYGVRVVAPEQIHREEVDVFAPCALGGILNDRTIPELGCRGIAGLANNQLERPEDGAQLLERGIAYAPDFVVNSGGVIRATMPIFSKPDKELASRKIAALEDTILGILEKSRDEGVSTEVVAEAIALERIEAGLKDEAGPKEG